jgi:hypothetical protein
LTKQHTHLQDFNYKVKPYLLSKNALIDVVWF